MAGQQSNSYITYWQEETLKERFEHQLEVLVSDQFAFLDDSYKLFDLIAKVPLPARGNGGRFGGFGGQQGKIGAAFANRQGVIWPAFENNQELVQQIRDRWTSGSSFGLGLSDEEKTAMVNAGVTRFKAMVDKIRSRGGELVIVKPPTAGTVLENEDKFMPRQMGWERLLKEADVFGIHFEDHPELTNLNVVDWSHLSGESAKEFTETYVSILCDEVSWLKEHGASCSETQMTAMAD